MDPPDGECWQAGEDVPEPDQPLGKVAPLGETEGPRDATALDRPTSPERGNYILGPLRAFLYATPFAAPFFTSFVMNFLLTPFFLFLTHL